MAISFQPVAAGDEADVTALATMAARIWMEHYRPILSEGQIRYMVDAFQSAEAIRRQLGEGYRYVFLIEDGRRAGYAAVRDDGDRLFLSKLYVDAVYRRRGIAKAAIAAFCEECRRTGRRAVWLTVNRHNTSSIAAYERMGFVRVDEQVTDIGGGYVMDDYYMEKTV